MSANKPTIKGTWGYPDTDSNGLLLFGCPALCSTCDHNKFQIVLIADEFGEHQIAMCDQCGTLHPILPITDD